MKSIVLAVFLVFACGLAFSQPQPVASYPFNGNAIDVSGNGNHGILGGETANPTLAKDRFGNANSAFQFGGFYNKNWIRIPNSSSLKFGSKLSISLWFQQCSFDGMDGNTRYSDHGYFQLITKSGDGIAANAGIWSSTYTDANNVLNINFNNINGNGQPVNFSGHNIMKCFDLCEWVHFAVVIDDTIMRMYFNGQLQEQSTINHADFTYANTQDFYIGRMFQSTFIWYPFNGIIDDIDIYNTAITAEDVAALYGNYVDPLAINNKITVDSVKTNSTCTGSKSGTIALYPNINNAPYQYSIDGGLTYQNSNIFSNLVKGTYSVKIKTSCNEKDTLIVVNEINGFNMNSSVSICQGQNYLGHTVSGDYVEKHIATNGCDSIITTNLKVNPLPMVNLGNDITACAGTQVVLDAGIANSKYHWNTGDTTQTIKPTAKGQYSVTVTDSNNCTNSDMINISIAPNPIIISLDTLINQQITIFATNGTEPYQYSINDIDYQSNPIFSNLLPNDYTITVRDANNCATTATVSISDHKIVIPNFFTPNSDGVHDTWEIKGIQAFPDAMIQIFDRFGKLLIEYNGSQKGWNGFYNGSPIKSDDYWYLINLNDGQPIYKGHVTIKR